MLEKTGRNIRLKSGVGLLTFSLIVLFSGSLSYGQVAVTTAPGSVGSVSNALSVVPSDAWVALVINDLSKTSQQLDNYAAKFGVEPPVLQRKLSRMLGVSGQADMSKPIILVVMSKETYGDRPVAVIVGVKDFEAFATGIKGQATETPGLMKGQNDELGDIYFGKKGTLVVMGPTELIVKDIIAAKQGFASSMDSGATKLMKESNMYIRVNLQSLGAYAKPILMGVGAMMQMGGLGGAMGGDASTQESGNSQAQAQAQAMQALGGLINAFIGFIDELNSFDIGVKFEADNILAGLVLSFKGGQDMASVLAAQKPTSEPLVKGLSGESFMLCGGWTWNPKMTKFQEALLQINPGMNPADAEKYKTLQKQLMELSQGASFKIDMRRAKAGEPLIEFQQILSTKDAKQYIELTRQLLELQSNIKSAGSSELKFKYEAGVAKVGNVSVDQVTMDMNKLLNMPGMPGDQIQQVKSLMTTVLGSANGMVQFHVAAVNNKLVAVSFGGGQAGMEQLIKSALKGETPLAKNTKVSQVAALLPKERIFEAYMDLGKLAGGIMSVATTMGEKGGEEPASMPTVETPLVAANASIQGTALRMDVVVPTEVVSQLMGLRYMIPTSLPAEAPKD